MSENRGGGEIELKAGLDLSFHAQKEKKMRREGDFDGKEKECHKREKR